MRSTITGSIVMVAVLGFLVGCAAQPTKETPSVADQGTVADDTAPTSVIESDTDTSPAPMIYFWQTGFSGFISAPIDVRREAHLACNERGFEVAVMAQVAIDGDTVTAEFTCRGDAE